MDDDSSKVVSGRKFNLQNGWTHSEEWMWVTACDLQSKNVDYELLKKDLGAFGDDKARI